MKYELKRKTTKGILLGVLIMAIGIFAAVIGEEVAIFGAFFALMGGGSVVNEIMRSKDPKFTFDENGFYIGETRYSYKKIEKITTRRDRYVTNMKIIIDGEVVYKFDTSYENANEFIKQLTLSGVEHNLFGR